MTIYGGSCPASGCESDERWPLGHDGGVRDHLLYAGLLYVTAAPGCLDAGRQQCLQVFFPSVLSPACQAGRIDGQFGL